MNSRMMEAVSIAILIASLVLTVVAAYVGPYVVLVGLALLIFGHLRLIFFPLMKASTWLYSAALGLALLSVILEGPAVPANWVVPVIFLLPFLSVGFEPIRLYAAWLATPTRLAGLALAGAFIGLLAGIVDVVVAGQPRAAVFNNPIHYGGLMLILGFAALSGSQVVNRWRYIFYLGPIFAVLGIQLSASRGPFLAAVILAAALLPMIVVWNWRDKAFIVATVVGLPLGLLVLMLSPYGRRAVHSSAEVWTVLSTGDFNVVDPTRTQLLTAAWASFQNSPLWGHGFSEMMNSVQAYLPAEGYWEFDHLHADVANFGVSAGAMGIAAYILVLVAPTVLAFEVRSKPATVVAVVATLGYAVLGLTNAMFGVLPQSVLFVALLGWIRLLKPSARVRTH